MNHEIVVVDETRRAFLGPYTVGRRIGILNRDVAPKTSTPLICASLVFHRDNHPEDYREAWADSIRTQLLVNLSKDFNWHICCELSDEVMDQLRGYPGVRMLRKENKIVIIDCSSDALHFVVPMVWSEVEPGNEIQGYLLEPGSSDKLKVVLSEEPAKRFWTCLESAPVVFATYPAENRYFWFWSVQMTYSELVDQLDLDALELLLPNSEADT
jgi:hypothetical protein